MEQARIAEAVRKEGFDPIYISDPPGRTFAPHLYQATKLLAFFEGSMEVFVQGQKFDCRPSDMLIIPGNVEHSTVAGPKGCGFFWSEKL